MLDRKPMRSVRLWALCMAGLLFAGCIGDVPVSNPYDPDMPAEQQAKVTIRGTVRNVNGDPVSDVDVDIQESKASTSTTIQTDTSGNFSVTELSPGRYTVSTRTDAYFDYNRDVDVLAGEDRALDIRLILIPEGGVEGLSGSLVGVVQRQGGVYSNILVEIVDSSTPTTITNPQGAYLFNIRPGTYTLRFTAEDHDTVERDNIVVSVGEETVVPTVVLEATPGSISGVVYREGAPSETEGNGNISISLVGSENSFTQDDGTFTISGVPAGMYTLNASLDDFDTQSMASVVVRGGGDTVVPPLFLLRSRGDILGVVTLQGRAPDENSGIMVGIDNIPYSTLTTANGSFLLSRVPVGTYSLSATADGFIGTGAASTFTISANTQTTVAAFELAIDPGSVEGMVTLEGESTHTGIDVSLSPGAYTTTTSATGAFSLTGVVEGAYTLTASKLGFSSESVDVIISAGGIRSGVGLVLAIPRGDISGLVQVEGNSPTDLSQVQVKLNGGSEVTLLDAAGAYSFKNLPAGESYSVTATLDGFVPDTESGLGVVVNNTTTATTLYLRASVGDFQINNGDYYTNDMNITLALSFTDPLGGAATMRISEDASFSDAVLGDTAYKAYAVSPGHTLSTGDALKTVYVQYRGSDNIETDVFRASITLDTTPPETAVVLINAGDTYSSMAGGFSTLGLNASDSGSGVKRMQIANVSTMDDDGDGTENPFDNYATSYVWTLAQPTVSETKTVYVKFEDFAGNIGTAVNDTIEFDITPPSLSGLSIDCNGSTNASHCSSPFVTVSVNRLVAEANVIMALSNTGSFGGATFVPFQNAAAWSLVPEEGTQTVYVMLRDAAGNETAGTDSDSTILDTTGPSLAITLSGSGRTGTSTTLVNSANISVGIVATDTQTSTANLEIVVSDRSDYTDGTNPLPWIALPLSGVVAHTLSTPTVSGDKRVFVRVRDEARNSTETDASIELDIDSPVVASAMFSEGLVSSQAAVTLELSYSGDTYELQIGGDVVGGGATWVSASPSIAVTLAANAAPGGSEVKTISVKARDLAGNEVSYGPVTITLDEGSPSGTLQINGIDSDTRERNAILSLSGVSGDTVAYALGNGASLDCGTASYSAASFPLDIPWTLEDNDGQVFVSVCFKDDAGNTGSASDDINLDRVVPSISSFTIDAGAAYSTDAGGVVSLQMDATDADASLNVEISEDATFSSGVLTTTMTSGTTKTLSAYTLSGGQGVHYLYLRISDSSGNNAESSASIILDSIGPQLPALSIIEGVVTGSTAVTLALSAINADELYIDGDVDDAFNIRTWIAYDNGVGVTLATTGGSCTLLQCGRNITVIFRDAAGNVTPIQTDGILLDRTAPTGNVSILGTAALGPSAAITRTPVVTLTLVETDAVNNAATQMMISNDSGFAGAGWQAFTSTVSWTLASGDASGKTVYAKFLDAAGNEGTGTTAAIELDTTAPTLTITPAVTESSSAAVNLVLSAYDEATILDTDLQLFVGSASIGLLNVDGITQGNSLAYPADDSVVANFNAADAMVQVTLRVGDPAGNQSGPIATVPITIDLSAPPTPTLTFVDSLNRGARVSWTGVTDAGAFPTGVSGYRVCYRLFSETGCPSSETIVGSTQAIITGVDGGGLLNKENYIFDVRALDAAGNESMPSQEARLAIGWKVLPIVPAASGRIIAQDIVYQDGKIYVLYHEQSYAFQFGQIGAITKLATSSDAGATWSISVVQERGHQYFQEGPIPGRVRSTLSVGRNGIGVVTVDWNSTAMGTSVYNGAHAGAECPAGFSFILNVVDLTLAEFISSDSGASWKRQDMVTGSVGASCEGVFSLGMSRAGSSRVVLYNASNRTGGLSFETRMVRKFSDERTARWQVDGDLNHKAPGTSYSACNANYIERAVWTGGLAQEDGGYVENSPGVAWEMLSPYHGTGTWWCPGSSCPAPPYPGPEGPGVPALGNFNFATVACAARGQEEFSYVFAVGSDNLLYGRGVTSDRPLDIATAPQLTTAMIDVVDAPDIPEYIDETMPVAAWAGDDRVYVGFRRNDDGAYLVAIGTATAAGIGDLNIVWKTNVVDNAGDAGYNPVMTGYGIESVLSAYTDLAGSQLVLARSALMAPQVTADIRQGLARYTWSDSGADTFQVGIQDASLVSCVGNMGRSVSYSVTNQISYTDPVERVCVDVQAYDENDQGGDFGQKWLMRPFAPVPWSLSQVAGLEGVSSAGTAIGTATSGGNAYFNVVGGLTTTASVDVFHAADNSGSFSTLPLDTGAGNTYPYKDLAQVGQYVHVVYNQQNAGIDTIEYRRSIDYGASFGAAIVAVSGTGVGPFVRVAAAGAVVVITYLNTARTEVHMVYSMDNGATWRQADDSGTPSTLVFQNTGLNPIVGSPVVGTLDLDGPSPLLFVYFTSGTTVAGRFATGRSYVSLITLVPNNPFASPGTFGTCLDNAMGECEFENENIVAAASNAGYYMMASVYGDRKMQVTMIGGGETVKGPSAGTDENVWVTLDLDVGERRILPSSLDMVGNGNGVWIAYGACSDVGLTSIRKLKLAYCRDACHSAESWEISVLANDTSVNADCSSSYYNGVSMAVDSAEQQLVVTYMTDPGGGVAAEQIVTHSGYLERVR